jgi:hypothetical protein
LVKTALDCREYSGGFEASYILTLARQFPDLADELKGQIEADQEKNRNQGYDLQVSLAKLREAISQLPEPKAKVQRKRRASQSPEQTTE